MYCTPSTFEKPVTNRYQQGPLDHAEPLLPGPQSRYPLNTAAHPSTSRGNHFFPDAKAKAKASHVFVKTKQRTLKISETIWPQDCLKRKTTRSSCRSRRQRSMTISPFLRHLIQEGGSYHFVSLANFPSLPLMLMVYKLQYLPRHSGHHSA